MNLILLHSHDQWIDSSTVLLSDQRFVHMRDVLHVAVGQTVKVGRVAGKIGKGLITSIDAMGVRLSVDLTTFPPPRHRLDLIVSLPRPKMLRRILRIVAEFGVANLHFINSARVEKSFWQSPLLRQDKVQEALCVGLSQGSDTILPKVHLHRRFRPFVEDELVPLCGDRPCWIADRDTSTSLLKTPPEPSLVIIGPEGGFVPFEIHLAESLIAKRVQLGPRILSVDTAVTAALAQTI